MSKELEVLKILRPNTTYEPYYTRSERRNACSIIETALKDYEQLKINYSELEDVNAFYTCECKDKLIALDIIKEKQVNLEYLKCCETYEQYKTICSYWNEITQEEFDLLKEILK